MEKAKLIGYFILGVVFSLIFGAIFSKWFVSLFFTILAGIGIMLAEGETE